MASTYNYLGIELMATGENAGTWGNKTNTNLNIIQQAATGYHSQSIAGGAQTTALLITDGDDTTSGLTNAARNVVIELTGTITGNQIVTIPNGIEKTYIISNGTTGAFTVEFKTVSGTGVTFATDDKGVKLLFSDGTDVVDTQLGVTTDPAGSDTEIQFNNAGAFGASSNLTWDGTNVQVGATGEVRFADTDNSNYIGLKAAGTVSSNQTFVLPTADGAADEFLKTDGSGNLSFSAVSGGTSWQAVKTTGFTAVAGEGYFCDTSSGAFTATLPASPSLGDEVTLVDYAGTFDTNNLTVGRNSENIQGSAADLTVSIERAGLTLVYSGSTYGWLLKDK